MIILDVILLLRLQVLLRADIDHIRRTRHHNIGNPFFDGGTQSLRPHHIGTAGDLINELGGGDIQHSAEEILLNHLFHDLSAGNTARMENQYFVAHLLQQLSAPLYAGRRYPKTGDCDALFPVFRQLRHPCHAVDDTGGLGKDMNAHEIEALNIHHRVNEQNVLSLHIGQGIAACHGPHYNLGNPQRELLHGTRGNGGASAATQRNDPIQPALPQQAAGQRGKSGNHIFACFAAQ